MQVAAPGHITPTLRSPVPRRGHLCTGHERPAPLHAFRRDPLGGALAKASDTTGGPNRCGQGTGRKKYARREEFQGRARNLLTLIDSYVTASPPDGYSKIRHGVTVEVLPDERGHHRMPSNDNDEEILERCEFLGQVTGNPVTLITGDPGMRVAARAAASTSSSCRTNTSCRSSSSMRRTDGLILFALKRVAECLG
jgi:hypothetical protein